MPKLELTKEQLATLREAFIFGVEDRGSLDDTDKAIVAAIDHALVDPRILAARGALGSLTPEDRLLVIYSYCMVCGYSLEDNHCPRCIKIRGPQHVDAPPDIPFGIANLRKQTNEAISALTPNEKKVLEERFGIGKTVINEDELGPSASPEVMAERSRRASEALKFMGIDRTKDGGTGGGVKERQTLLLTVAERELLIEALRTAIYEAQKDFDDANSRTELIGNAEVLGPIKKRVDDLRALLIHAQELINS